MAGHQVFGPDSIGDWSYVNSTTVQLASSTITVGGLQYDTGNLQVSTAVNGVGGLDVTPISNNEKYYVYAVKNGTDVALIGSLSSTGPSGYTSYKQINSFYTNNVGGVYSFITNTPRESEWINGGPIVITSTEGVTAPTKGTTGVDVIWWRRIGSNMECRCEYFDSTAGVGGGDGSYLVNIPAAAIIDTTKLNIKTIVDGRGGSQRQYSGIGAAQLNYNVSNPNASQANGQWWIYSQTELGITAIYDRGTADNAHGEWGESSNGTTTEWFAFGTSANGISMSGSFSVPIVGWDK